MKKINIVLKLVSTFDGEGEHILTNIDRNRVSEILEDWLSRQSDDTKNEDIPDNKEEYVITLKFNPKDDSFILNSNTGSDVLTAGIILDFASRIDSIPVRKL